MKIKNFGRLLSFLNIIFVSDNSLFNHFLIVMMLMIYYNAHVW